MQDKISVIIPIYNVEKYVSKCIESVINQSYKNLEIIIINDGSTDNSKRICTKYSKIDNRIIFIDQENQGISMVRNNGIDIATGKYVGFVDGDDYINYDMFEFLYKNLCDYNADISMCNTKYIYENGETIINKKGKEVFKHYNLNTANSLLLENNKKIKYFIDSDNNYLWNKLYKKSLFSQIYFPRNKVYEDIFTTFKLIDKANRLIIFPEYKYYYVKHKASITNQFFKNNQFDRIEGYIERYRCLSDKYPAYEPLLRKYIFTSLLQCLHNASTSNNFDLHNDAMINAISIVKKYDISKCGLSEGQENLLKMIFSDIKRCISIVKFYKQTCLST